MFCWGNDVCDCVAGTLAPLRRILSAFFSHEKLRLGKMKKLARLLTGRRPESTQPGTGRSPSLTRASLLATIDKWAQDQPEARLRRLAHTLKGEMYHVGLELENKISEIDEEMKQCENNINTLTLNKDTEEQDRNDIRL